MTRHSKNNTASSAFTYHEKRKAGHGTEKRRFGKDSQISFGSCCLCLQKARDPVITPGGYFYCRECIYDNLLQQKQEIARKQAAFEEQEKRLREREEEAALEARRKEIQNFTKTEDSLGTVSKVGKANGGKKGSEEDGIKQKIASKVDTETRDEKREALKRTSFWIPDFTPGAEERIEAPRTHTVDPMTGDQLKSLCSRIQCGFPAPVRRWYPYLLCYHPQACPGLIACFMFGSTQLKHLMPAKVKWTEDSSNEKYVTCEVTQKSITHQKAVFLRPSGVIVLETCLKDIVLPTMTCPVTGMKLKKKDIINLVPGGSSFSAHSNVEAKRYKPNMT